MESNTNEVTHNFTHFRVYKDGRIERLRSLESVPAGTDPHTGVQTKDVVISPETGVSVRLYLPKITDPNRKLPVLVHIHGGGFCLGSASSRCFYDFVCPLVAEANIIAVSVDYRLAPEHPLPIAYDDSWDAFRWVASHAEGNGPQPWLNDHADFRRFFLGGESAGANLASNVAIRAGLPGAGLNELKLAGLVLIQPYFGGKVVDQMYKYMCPSSSGRDDDPRFNPASDPHLRSMPCERVLLCLAEKDFLRDVGWGFYEALKKSGWGGEVEVLETEGEGHGFHILDPTCEKAMTQLRRVASFLN